MVVVSRCSHAATARGLQARLAELAGHMRKELAAAGFTLAGAFGVAVDRGVAARGQIVGVLVARPKEVAALLREKGVVVTAKDRHGFVGLRVAVRARGGDCVASDAPAALAAPSAPAAPSANAASAALADPAAFSSRSCCSFCSCCSSTCDRGDGFGPWCCSRTFTTPWRRSTSLWLHWRRSSERYRRPPSPPPRCDS